MSSLKYFPACHEKPLHSALSQKEQRDCNQPLISNFWQFLTFCRPSRTVCRFLFRISSLDSYFILRSGTTAIRLKRMSWYGSLKNKVQQQPKNEALRISVCVCVCVEGEISLLQPTGSGLTRQWPVQFSPWLPVELYLSIPPPLPKDLKYFINIYIKHFLFLI